MSGQTIRDVLIRVAIEQKSAVLQVPSVVQQPMPPQFQSAAQTGGPRSAAQETPYQGADRRMSAGVDDVEKMLADLNKALDAEEKAKQKAYEAEVREAQRAYSRIMRERDKLAAEAEKQLEREQKAAERAHEAEVRAAQSAYSRIMKERDRLEAEAKRQLELETKAAEKAYEEQVREAQSAYSRIMRERAKNEADAERAYDAEASEALSAYSRIMKSREDAAQKQLSLNKQIEAQKSAVLAAYGTAATSALQMAKGIAFVTAANEDEAASFVKVIAATQGYFDLAVGGIHIFKAMNDIKRQSVTLSVLQATANGAETSALAAQTVAAGAATKATMSLNAAMLLNPITLIITGLAAATLAVRSYAAAEEQAAKDIAEAEQKIVDWRLKRAKIEADSRSKLSALRVENLTEGDETGLQEQIRRLAEARDQLTKTGNQIMPMGSTEELAARAERSKELTEQSLALAQQEHSVQSALISDLRQQQQVLFQNVALANQRVEAERSALQAVNQQIGALSVMDKARAKRIQAQLDSGQQVSHQDLTFAAGLGGTEISRIAKEQLEKQGEESGIRRDEQPLKGAQQHQADMKVLQEDVRSQIDPLLQTAVDNQKKLVEFMKDAIGAIGLQGVEIERLRNAMKDEKKELEKRTFLGIKF